MIPLALLVLAAVPNPDPPLPYYELSPFWVSYSNDSYADQAHDDLRTAAISAACPWVSADYQIGTDRHQYQRADELAMAGWWRSTWWSAGAGARISSSMGGERIQDEYHRIDSGDHVVGSYERAAWEPLVVGQVRFRRAYDSGIENKIAIDTSALMELSTHGFRSEAKIRGTFGRPPGAAVLGGVLWLDRATALSGTAASIERDRGRAAVEMGMVLDRLQIMFWGSNTGSMWAAIAVGF